jgi:hypothetical protein
VPDERLALNDEASAAVTAHKKRLGIQEPISSDLLMAYEPPSREDKLKDRRQDRMREQDLRWETRWRELGADNDAFQRVMQEMEAEVYSHQQGKPSGMAPTKD